MKGKRLLAIALCLLMTISLLPVSALADGGGEEPAAPAETTADAVEETDGKDALPDEEPEDAGDEAVENGLAEKALLSSPENRDVSLPDGIYLNGTRNDWNINSLTEALKFRPNPNGSNEYMLEVTLASGEEFKVIKVQNGNVTWFPDPGSNYHVANDRSGQTTIYFKEEYQSDWSDFGGYFYVSPTYAIGINTLYPANAATLRYPSRAAENQTVKIIINANEGYRLNSFALYKPGWLKVDCTPDGSDYIFTMPPSDVGIDARFSQSKPITVVTQVLDGEGINATDSLDVGSAAVSPTSGFEGDTITLTVSPNPGYRFKNATGDVDHLTPVDGVSNTYTFKLTFTNDAAFTVNVRFTEHMEEGYYLRLSDADEDYRDWTYLSHKLVQGDSTFISTNNDVFYHAKVQLTVGQLLRVYHLSYSGNQLQGTDNPVASYTVTSGDVVAGQLSTVYLKYAAAGSEIGVSAFNGYYLIFHYYYPYDVPAQLKLTLQDGVYINEDSYLGTDRVRVAHYTEGTIDQLFLDGSYHFVPREGDEYQGPTGFPYGTYGTYGTGAPGRAYFLPDGSGDESYIDGYLKIRRLYGVTYVGDNCSFAGNPATAPAGEPLAITVTADAGYEVASVIATWNDGTDQSAELTLSEGKYTLAQMPPYPVTIIATAGRRTVPVTVTVIGDADKISYTLWTSVHSAEGPDGCTEITDGRAPVGQYLYVQVAGKTENDAGTFYISTEYVDEDGELQGGEGGGEFSGSTQTGWNEVDCLGDGPVAVTLVVDPVDLTLEPNGAAGFTEYQQIPSGYTTSIRSNPFTREGYVFLGWNTKADGSGTAYPDGADITLTEPLTLYAQWVKMGYYLVRVPASEPGVGLTDTANWLELTYNPNATLGSEYMSGEISLAQGDKLFVVHANADGTVEVWNNTGTWNEFALDDPAYTVDANHADDHVKVYFREQTPNPETHPFWQDFGGHLFIAIAREIDVTSQITDLGAHGAVTASPETGVYTETITLTATPETGYQLYGDPWVTYRDSSNTEQSITATNGVFTMPDYPVVVHALFVLEDGYYMNGTMNSWTVADITPAMKFAKNLGSSDDEYMLVHTFRSTDQFKVVRLVNGEIADWYGTQLDGHMGLGDDYENYVINDQTGERTVYFRPLWHDDWSGHIYISNDTAYAYYVGSTGSFNDNIKLNFYVKYQEAGQDAPMPDNIYAVLTCVDKTVKIQVASAPRTINGYKLSIDLVAKQIEDDVTLKLVVGEDGAEAFPFRSQDGVEDYTETGKKDSLLDYFTRAIDSGTTSDTMKALARAARDYCYAAAQEFGYNWHDQYAFSAAVENVTAATLADYKEVEDGNYPTGVSHKGYSVMFEADNSFRKYLKFTDVENPEEAFTYKVDGTVAPLLKQATRGYYLTFKKVYSNKLQKPHTIEISDGTNTYMLSASVLTYCRLVLLSDKTSDAMKTLAKAAYVYNQAAIAQFGE